MSKKLNPVKDAWKKVRKFSMTGESKQENCLLDIWRLMNGHGPKVVPELNHLSKIIPGDLVIANRLGVINPLQKYSINCFLKARSDEGGEVEVHYSLSVSKPMNMTHFLNGADVESGEDPIFIDGDDGEVEYPGANKLMEDYLHTVAGDDYVIFEQPYTIFCYSPFLSKADYNEFIKNKMILSTQLKVAA